MKPQFLFYLAFIVILSTGNSCEKDPAVLLCPKGSISVGFEEISLPLLTEDSNIEYIINDDSTYQATFQLWIYNNQEFFPNYLLPNIDFSKKTLLGKYSLGTTKKDNNTFLREVCLDRTKKEYRYTIKLIPTEDKAIHFSMNWILISKIPLKYKVDIEIE